MQKINLRIDDKETVNFVKGVIKSKRPVLVHGDIESGKTTFMKFLADFLIFHGEKLISLCDSPELETFEFVEHYQTLWLLPEQLRGLYKEVHPNLHIEYVDLINWEDLFRLIETSQDDVIICHDFFPLLLFGFSQKNFKSYFPNFPESILFAIELSTAINAREWRTKGNILSGALIRMIRHGGKNGFHFLGDAQSLEDIDVTFRRTGGFKVVFKKMRLRRSNPIHNYIVMNFPELERKIQNLPKTEFIVLDGGKIVHGINSTSTFHKKKFDSSEYFIVNKRVSFRENIQLLRAAKNAMKDIISPTTKKS